MSSASTLCACRELLMRRWGVLDAVRTLRTSCRNWLFYTYFATLLRADIFSALFKRHGPLRASQNKMHASVYLTFVWQKGTRLPHKTITTHTVVVPSLKHVCQSKNTVRLTACFPCVHVAALFSMFWTECHLAAGKN